MIKNMPRSLEAERAVLGAILVDPKSIDVVIDRLDGPESFYEPEHQDIFRGFLELLRKGTPIEIVPMVEELKGSNHFSEKGCASYLSGLIDSHSIIDLGYHAKMIEEKAIARRIVEVASKIQEKALGGYEGDLERLVDFAESELLQVTKVQDRRRRGPRKISDIVQIVLRETEERQQSGVLPGIPTGFYDLDRFTAGFQPGDLVILAGRPSMGKTAFALNLCENATNLEKNVLFCSLEMSSEQLATRLIMANSRVSGRDIRTGQLSMEDWEDIHEAARVICHQRMMIDDSPAQTLAQVRSKARKVLSESGELDMIIIDYLQLMSGSGESREKEISAISRGLKSLAKELSVPVLALSQLNRSVEHRQEKRPTMADLRESGAIEQDADVILFIYRDVVYNKSAPKELTEIIIGKQRNGPVGVVQLGFDQRYQRFKNMTNERF